MTQHVGKQRLIVHDCVHFECAHDLERGLGSFFHFGCERPDRAAGVPGIAIAGEDSGESIETNAG
jgi:hypothetical protein